ncbi:HalOD1 output domain-containing protein [Natronosalvus rutilus]|uniref:Halobacterial output domain-containing protein n=1 Tax=Natronosalvus rutilus TaxID=2953753 RepID=A0A9E7ND43_9EURY|nr:HalOD1 output domain-containing protein [Natronosalvus rutilus]UTF55321.1 hypothetical protein NGM29_08750 [Natronosalvus rutilus]
MIDTQAGVELASMAFHPESETYRAEYDQTSVSASMAVVAVLSEVMDVDPVELEPLHASVNTGALDNLARVRDGTGEGVSITFRVATYAITVSNDGTVALTSREQTGTDGVTEGVSPV